MIDMTYESGHRVLNRILSALILFFGALFLFPAAGAETDSMLETGNTVGTRMRSVAAGKALEDWTATGDIKAIRRADSLPDGFAPNDLNTISTADSKYPVYIFFDNEENAGVLYFYTEGSAIAMNPDSSFMFAFNTALTDISGLACLDSSHVASLYGAFMRDMALPGLAPLADWNTSSLQRAGIMFLDDSSLADISALANWDVSGVTEMYGLFAGTSSLTDACSLRDWDTSNVTDMGHMFAGATSLAAVDVSNWNTGRVVSMANMFQVGDNWVGNGQLREIIGIGNLDVSNVTDMTCMFYGAGRMTNYDIAGWDVSRVESMNHMFCDNYFLRSLDLSAWDVSNVRTMYCMFDDNERLKTIGDVSRWNTASLVDAGGWLNGANSFVGNDTGKLDLSGWNTKNLKVCGEMFRATQLCIIDLSGWTFESVTNQCWEGTGEGIFYETGNNMGPMGMGEMFKNTAQLNTVYISHEGLESYNKAAEDGVSIRNMWTGSNCPGFTVR